MYILVLAAYLFLGPLLNVFAYCSINRLLAGNLQEPFGRGPMGPRMDYYAKFWNCLTSRRRSLRLWACLLLINSVLWFIAAYFMLAAQHSGGTVPL